MAKSDWAGFHLPGQGFYFYDYFMLSNLDCESVVQFSHWNCFFCRRWPSIDHQVGEEGSNEWSSGLRWQCPFGYGWVGEWSMVGKRGGEGEEEERQIGRTNGQTDVVVG